MKVYLFFLILILQFPRPIWGAESFTYNPVEDFGFKLSVSTNKRNSKAIVKNVFRDREGDSFALIYTQGAFPVFGGKTSTNLPDILPQDNLFTIVRISPKGEPLWTFHLNNRDNRSFTLNHFSVSPQGNIAIGINFSGSLTLSQSLRQFNSMERDQVFLFLRKSNGALMKDLHFTGAQDEFGGAVIWGTGGELLIHLKSSSNKVAYDHGHYSFHLKSLPKKPIVKDLFINLKKTFFPKWRRSIEPAGTSSTSFFDKEKVLIGFNHSSESQGLYRQGGSVKVYNKAKKTPMRAVAVSLGSAGDLEWDAIFKDFKSSGALLNTKVFHDGGVGLFVQMGGRRLALSGSGGASRVFSHFGKESSKQIFVKLGAKGSLEESSKIYGTESVNLIPTSSTDNLFIHKTRNKGPVKSKKTFKNENGASSSIGRCSEDNNQHLFVVDEEFNYAYQLEAGDCEKLYPLDISDFRLGSGHLEILKVTKEQSIELFKIPYREEVLDDETIPGLAYTPNFINDRKGDDKKVDYNFSYAIPAQVNGVMVYFIKEGRDHLEALRDPMLQVSLNAAYFRNYIPITVWTSHKEIMGKRLEGLFDKLISKDILKTSWDWYFNAFGERANQINSLYKDRNTNSIGKLDPKLLVLWNLKNIPDPKVEPEKLRQQVARSRDGLFISSFHLKEDTAKTHELYLEYDRQKKKSSHIITEPIKIYERTFLSVPEMPRDIAGVFYQEMVKKGCIDKNNEFTKNPYESEFREGCVESMASLEGYGDSLRKKILWFSQQIYSPSDFSPFYDKEIFNFIEGTK